MSGSDQQIVTSYEELGMTVEQISCDTGWEPLAVKASLLQNSSLYRAEQNSKGATLENAGKVTPNPIEDFDQKDLIDSKTVLRELLHAEDDPHLRFKVAKFMRDEKKGRLDPIRAIKDIKNITVQQFNITLVKAREARARAAQKFIEVDNVSQLNDKAA